MNNNCRRDNLTKENTLGRRMMHEINKIVIKEKIRKRFLVNGEHTLYKTINELVPVSNTHIVDIAFGVIGMTIEIIFT